MFDEILGLPAHPLIIHGAVVLTPLAVVLSVVYAVVPRWRPLIIWAVVPLAIISPLTVFAARQSGEALESNLYGPQGATGQLGERIAEHSSFANPLLYATLGLGAAALALVYGAPRVGKAIAYLLSGAVVVLALVVGFFVFRAGHTGAEAVWLN